MAPGTRNMKNSTTVRCGTFYNVLPLISFQLSRFDIEVEESDTADDESDGR